MTLYRAVLLALFVVGGAVAVAVPAGATSVGVEATGVTVSDEPIGDTRPMAANDTTNNSTLGADISSFMQSSAAEVGGAVETGMWTAAFNATENQSVQTQLVERRTDELRTELAELQQRKENLVAEREAGNITAVAYKAKISRLLGQINALRSAIDATSTRAAQANASVESLDTLRSETENLTGPEISSVARNVTGVGVGNGTVGRPDDAGNGNGVGNGDTGADETGPPAATGNGSASNANPNGSASNATLSNGTNASAPGGPPDDSGKAPIVGNGTENGTTAPNGSAPGTPPGNETEAGNGTEVGDATGNGNSAGVGNGNDAGNGNSAGVGNGVRADSLQTLTSAVTAPDLFDRVSEALSVRTDVVEYALTVA